ncbi:MAG: type III-A CRISPR-associated protein Csm2 [Cyclobacteriaceae bacterium]|nr:type III-A CRISPR-associated protein Csm2 [Cyclobacteriaceae bacterium]MCX7638049.1 type III-A CRISPR-associated protein Csm2 [Cyclobacteriaceae bacterium]
MDKHKQKPRQKPETSSFKIPFQKEWIADKLDDKAIQFTEAFGRHLKENEFSTNQIRNFFGEVRRIEMNGVLKEKTAFILLRPKLAYAATRTGDSAKEFRRIMDDAHRVVMEKENDNTQFDKRFKNFVQFLEAILAYHKAAGGK